MFGIANLFLTSCYFSQASSTSYDADILLYIVYRIFKMFIRPKAAAVSGLKVRVFCRRYHTCLQRDLFLFLEAHLCSFAVRAGPSDSFPAIQPKWFACVLQEKLLFQRPGISPRWWKTCLCCRAGMPSGEPRETLPLQAAALSTCCPHFGNLCWESGTEASSLSPFPTMLRSKTINRLIANYVQRSHQNCNYASELIWGLRYI